ncbi:MAG TPA: STAS domain-containing protein [Candidatus Baltobacteraceae bacterium]|nr:STAS domain-containing protein [Candidatus Baltobacteraceae bacterium]
MTPELDREPTVVTIAFSGDLAAHSLEDLRAALADAESSDIVVLDLCAADYIDSTALTAFVLLRNRMLKCGRLGTIRIVAPSASVRRIFEVCHLDKLFKLYGSVPEALTG